MQTRVASSPQDNAIANVEERPFRAAYPDPNERGFSPRERLESTPRSCTTSRAPELLESFSMTITCLTMSMLKEIGVLVREPRQKAA